MASIYNLLLGGIIKGGGEAVVGEKCYSEIPKEYQIGVMLSFGFIYLTIFVKMRKHH